VKTKYRKAIIGRIYEDDLVKIKYRKAISKKLVKKINEITCPKCESAEVGFFFPAEIFNCNECKHEWRETDEH